MPSSVAHSFAGIFIHQVYCRNKPEAISLRKDWKALLPFLVLPNVPDIDWLISYLLFNDPRVLHSGITHTLAFAVIAAALLARWRIFGSPLATFTVSLTLLSSHLLLDMATGKAIGGLDGFGVMLFYPFSSERVSFPITLFLGIRHRTFNDLFNMKNVMAIFWEFLVLTPMVLIFGKSRKALAALESTRAVPDGDKTSTGAGR